LLEQYSIDEFFADISGWIKEEEIEAFAENLRQEIAKELSLPISIGIAPSKWIAKLCTNFAKPKGIKYIQQKDLDAFIFDIPIEDFAGIGRATQAKLHKYHKQTLGDIQASKTLLYSWGNSGKVLYDRVCGLDKDKVIHKRDRKSIGISRTFDAIKNRRELHRRIHILARHLLFLLNKQTLHPQTLHFGIRYTHASSKKQIPLEGILSEQFLYQTTIMIFKQLDIYPQSEVIRLTLSFSNFQDKAIQSRSLFAYHDERKAHELSLKTQNLREKYGIDILKWGSEL
jgi:DNA polymerase-4